MYPVRFELLDEGLDGQIKSIKEQVNQVPDHGLAYGVENYLSGTGQKEQGGRSEIRLNYLGEFDFSDNSYLSFSGLPSGPDTAPDNHMTTKLELNAMVMNGIFSMDVSYHTAAFKETTVQGFAKRFIDHLILVLDHISQEKDIHFTPSDFDVQLDQEELDELFM